MSYIDSLPNLLMCTPIALAMSAHCCAEFTVSTGNGASWLQSNPAHETIDFTEYPHNTPIREQYSNLGVHFTDTDGNWIISNAPDTYLQDGCGINGNQFLEITFDRPMVAFATYFPGFEYFTFFSGEQQLFATGAMGGGGTNRFVGFTTDVPFDRVLLHGLPPNIFGVIFQVFLDDVYFSSVPGPGGAAMAILAGALARPRRRRDSSS